MAKGKRRKDRLDQTIAKAIQRDKRIVYDLLGTGKVVDVQIKPAPKPKSSKGGRRRKKKD